MRNLRLAHAVVTSAIAELSGGDCRCIAVDSDTGLIYVALNNRVLSLDTTNQQMVHELSLVDEALLSPDGSSHIIAIHPFQEQMALCVATSCGNIVLWTPSTNQVECVGTVGTGIRAMGWSPDMELVAIISGEDSLILMTKEFDVLSEKSTHIAGFGEAQPITVGWGKKETQFHGSEGKAAALRPPSETATVGEGDAALKGHDRRPRVSWRSDGKFFAVSVINPDTSLRQVRVWTREGELHSTSEPGLNLGQALCYKPSGGLIAVCERKQGKLLVSFLEKNGLKHGEFLLPFSANEAEVMELAWNSDSTVLAVWCRDLASPTGSTTTSPPPLKSYVQLWTVGNYHWYLKQSLEYSGGDTGSPSPPNERSGAWDGVGALAWDAEQAYRLHVVSMCGRCATYTWTWQTDVSGGRTWDSGTDLVTVAVIDGNKVLMTPLRLMVVPPPMAAYELVLPSSVAQVAWGSGASGPSGKTSVVDEGGISGVSEDSKVVKMERSGVGEVSMVGGGSNDVLVLLGDGSMVMYGLRVGKDSVGTEGVKILAAGGSGFRPRCPVPQRIGTFTLSDLERRMVPGPLNIHHLTWVRRDTLVFSTPLPGRPPCAVVLAALDENTFTFRITSCVEVDCSVLAIAQSVDRAGLIAVQLTSGQVYRLSPETGTLTPWLTSDGAPLCFPQPCLQLAVCEMGEDEGGTHGDERGEGARSKREVVLGLTSRFRLYVDDVEIANNCTSFALHREFLLVATHAHTCRCIRRQTALEVLPMLSVSKAHVYDESVRPLERGSRLVAVVPDSTQVVLQTPRGNLEVIHPRALVLAAVRGLLNRLEYGEAFVLLKKHRVNMNVLYDHDPTLFLANTATFVTQLASEANINLFLSALQEEDVTKTMYTATYERQLDKSDPASTARPGTSVQLAGSDRGTGTSVQRGARSKLDTVCDNVRSTLDQLGAEKYLLSILTTYVKKSQPELENALLRIQTYLAKDVERANEALTYLLYHIDVNDLYNVALGTYDFDLVLMVAEKSQKDPKEYLAFLNELNSLEVNYRRYTIDLQLRRYAKALQHISKCGSERFAECLKLVKDHKLYSNALTLYPIASDEYKAISLAYAENLSEAGSHEEAGLIYARIGESQSALSAFIQACDWQQALCMAGRLKLGDAELNKLARSLAGSLVERRKHVEAACLLDQYCNHYEDAIEVLLSGAQWNEALRLIYKYDRPDLIETNVKPSLVDAAGHLAMLIDTTRAEFEKQRERLLVVRQKKADQLNLFELAGGVEGGEGRPLASDLYSDTSSVSGQSLADSLRSGGSRSSGHSRKSRKKVAQKRWSLREGSAFEDLALMDALHKAVTQVEQWKGDVSAMLRTLVLFCYDAEAERLQSRFDELLRVIEASVDVIWTPVVQPGAASSLAAVGHLSLGPESTANSITEAFKRKESLQLGDSLATKPDSTPSVPQPPPTPLINRNTSWRLSIVSERSRVNI